MKPWRRAALGLVIAFLGASYAVWGVVRWSNGYLTDRLASHAVAAPGSSHEASLMIDRMGGDTLAPLVDLASDADERVAAPARLRLEERLAGWVSAPSGGPVPDLNVRVLRLLAMLSDHADLFTSKGQVWVTDFTERLLTSSLEHSPGDSGRLIAAADNLLERIDESTPRNETTPAFAAAPAATLKPARSQSAPVPLPREPSPLPSPTTTPPRALAQENTAADPLEPLPFSNETSAHGPQPEAFAEQAPRFRAPAIGRGTPNDWSPDWGGDDDASPLAQRPIAPSEPERYSERSDLELLREWLSLGPLPQADFESGEPLDARRKALAAELSGRGYTGMSVAHLEALFASEARERLQLVERLMTEPAGDAARLLLLLAKDDSPLVRRAAISALASTNDPTLMRAALALAMHDRDPAVAEFAQRVRERLR
ncbi:hypothetical protein Mal64_11010 [Pseudobythopirellula maris]|uniref:HEAT repeat protein n=1 Tax=Pseudobythopirellula maris TaxID=2527991 RepID=A0A5C5ZU32_9BACT|nr:hypothetical protein [Pseudobythopirellula maris]TWT90706.1 hypothetical protein Mal64_11010 [Pseudobythopirellula maris]